MVADKCGARGNYSLGLKASHAASLSGEAGAMNVAFSSNVVDMIGTN